jgi:hypothetical protein
MPNIQNGALKGIDVSYPWVDFVMLIWSLETFKSR